MAIWAPIIAGVASLAGSLISNASNNRRERKAWERNNAYNHPLMQMQRLKDAGLNPHLVYGNGVQGATGSSSSPQKTSDLELTHDFFNQLQQYVGAQKTQVETDNAKVAREVMIADIALKGSQQAKNDIDTARSTFDLSQAERLKDISVQAAEQNLRNAVAQEGQTLATTDKLIADTALSKANTNVSNQTVRESQQRIKESQQRIRNMVTERDLKGVETEIKKIELQLRKIGINPNDPAGHRIIGRLLDETGMVDGTIDFIQNGAQGIKKWFNKTFNSK